MPRWLDAIRCFMLGGIAFWMPDLVLHAALRAGVDDDGIRGSLHSSLANLLPFATCFGAWRWLRRRAVLAPGTTAAAMILGIWMLGGYSLMASSWFSNPTAGYWSMPLWMYVWLAAFGTFLGSGYDGTALAVWGITVAAFFLARWESRRLAASECK